MLFVPLLAGQIARARPEMRGMLVSPLNNLTLACQALWGLPLTILTANIYM
ncbi:hypothetical protein CVH13_01011 [Dehalococcoides mccartyi]|uniref:Uncharacterized protein n=1 Tax=Dehalococcoides mccartyi TaxID=61435 RepID=A0A2J1DWX6_9CHLR|nr:hypothetical protein CVH13_01011 [Dehalococcoides mccartyi]